jgi:hypothetical protein
MRLLIWPSLVHQQIGAVAVQHAGPAAGERGRVLAGLEAVAGRLDAVDLDAGSSRKGWNRPMALEPPPMQAISESGRRPFGGLHLRARLVADDALEVAHHRRIGMRAGRPCRCSRTCRATLVTQSRSASFIASFSVFAPDCTGHDLRRRASSCGTRWASAARRRPRPCRRRIRGRSARTAWRWRRRAAGAGLGDDALLAHALGQQDLAEHVVDLVRAGVVELLALEIDLRAAAARQCAVSRSAK